MRKNILLTLLFLFSVGQLAQAQQISVADAQDNATEWLVKRLPRGANGRSANRTELTLAYTGQIEDEVQYYVFNRPNDEGFVIVGGDERATQILGYSDHGSFDYEHIPDNMRWFLGEHQQQIHNAIQRQLTPAPKKSAPKGATQAKTSVPDLVKAEWDQTNPFNCVFPTMSTGSKIYTGCVNTAVAQIMKRWNYPQTGIGSKTVSQQVSGLNTSETITFSADFENTTYQWDKMLDNYNLTPRNNDYLCSDPEVNQQAVSTLIYHVSIATGTRYGTYGSNYYSSGSSASSSDAAVGLVQYFGYANTMSNRRRGCYSNQDWEDMIYNELKAGRPVLYSGRTEKNSGHAFVCHGYDASNNTFAINWGWGGTCNGYFALTGDKVLTPNGTGSGGGATGSTYSISQSAITGISPTEFEVEQNVVACVEQENSTCFEVRNAKNTVITEANTGDVIRLRNINIYEELMTPQNLCLNIRLLNTSTGESYDILPYYSYYPYNQPNSYCNDLIATIKSDIPSGVYKVIPMYHFVGETDWKYLNVASESVYPSLNITKVVAPVLIYNKLYLGTSDTEQTVAYGAYSLDFVIGFYSRNNYEPNTDVYVSFKLKSETDEYMSSDTPLKVNLQGASYGWDSYTWMRIGVKNIRKNGKYQVIPVCKSIYDDDWVEMAKSGNPATCYITVTDCPLYGDVDLDNDLDQLDVETLVEMLISKRTSTLRADVDGNGSKTISDVTTLIELLK